ncbi:MAG: hypothetical protein JW760_07615 [Spirochaetales bacterium]|nr:hypothetical protein [Spirochaetales bacterium]
MKKIVMMCFAVLFFMSISPLFAAPTDDEIEYAFGISFGLFFVASMQSAFGMNIPGIELSEEGMLFSDVDLAALEIVDQGTYGTVSGSIIVENESDMRADLEFTGGPVNHLEWIIPNFDTDSDHFVVDISADGRNLHLDSSQFDTME